MAERVLVAQVGAFAALEPGQGGVGFGFAISSGLPAAIAFTSLKDSAVSPMSAISRVSRRPCITWPMNRACVRGSATCSRRRIVR